MAALFPAKHACQNYREFWDVEMFLLTGKFSRIKETFRNHVSSSQDFFSCPTSPAQLTEFAIFGIFRGFFKEIQKPIKAALLILFFVWVAEKSTSFLLNPKFFVSFLLHPSNCFLTSFKFFVLEFLQKFCFCWVDGLCPNFSSPWFLFE